MSRRGAPLLYEVAARPWLARLSARHDRQVTLGDVPDEDLQALADRGFDYFWPMGVWRTGDAATRIAREQPWLRDRWGQAFPDVAVPELVGSPFAVAEYVVDERLGGDEGLDRLRGRLATVGLGLILDVVPHHTATDAPWVRDHPDWYVVGTDAQRAADPAGFMDAP
ncbi:MAG: alpha-amylase, partial [Chloroflexi bacterium]|nr:alpha-amylase [Chloroflexota bacterium]